MKSEEPVPGFIDWRVASLVHSTDAKILENVLLIIDQSYYLWLIGIVIQVERPGVFRAIDCLIRNESVYWSVLYNGILIKHEKLRFNKFITSGRSFL